MRPSCYFCARKHIAKANIKFTEAQLGYPEHIDLGLAELSEAEDELVAERPDLATIVRNHRKGLEASLSADPTGAGYRVPIMELLKLCRDPIAGAVAIAKPVQTYGPPPEAVQNDKPRLEIVPQPYTAAHMELSREIAARPAHKQCTPCQEGAKVRDAAQRWSAARAAGSMKKLVAILAPLSDFNPAYSLVTVILDQVRALALDPTTSVALFVRSQANLDLLPPLAPNVEVFTSIPNIMAGEDQAETTQVLPATTWLNGIMMVIGQGYIFTHDLIFQSWFSYYAKALHEIQVPPGIYFYHWMHSSVGTRPTKPEAKWRTSVPAGHTMVALNTADLPYLQRYYQAEASSFVSIPNPRDVRVFYGMPKAAADLVTKHELHQADVFQLFPLSATRMQAKGLTKVIDIFKALTQIDGLMCRLLVADAHANGAEGRNNRELMIKYAEKVGLPKGVLTFTSESLPELAAYGLEASAVRCLFQLANVFIFPTTSEAGSLVLMEAALAGNLLVLNESLPCMADYISSTDAIWVPFGSAKEAAGTWQPATVADRIHADLAQSKPNNAKHAIMRGHCLENYAWLLSDRIFARDVTPASQGPEDIPLRQAVLLQPRPATASP